MKKHLLIFLLLPIITFSQVSVFQAEKTTDREIVEKFISDNPNHPAVPKLKKRATTLKYAKRQYPDPIPQINNNESKIAVNNNAQYESPAKNLSPEINTKGSSPKEGAQKTAAVLTHLFNSSPKKNEAAIQFVNKSSCNLDITIKGKKNYNISVAPKDQNYIIVNKGSYKIESSVCGAAYNRSRLIENDIAITINEPTYQ